MGQEPTLTKPHTYAKPIAPRANAGSDLMHAAERADPHTSSARLPAGKARAGSTPRS